MTIDLPKTPCWNCPEGYHPATCLDARIVDEAKKGKPAKYLLLLFEIHVQDDGNVQYLAKRKYELPPKAGSTLMNDLTSWLGEDFLRNQRQLDLAGLKGKKADVSLVHIHNERYPKPYVHIQAIYAPGAAAEDPEPISPRLCFDRIR